MDQPDLFNLKNYTVVPSVEERPPQPTDWLDLVHGEEKSTLSDRLRQLLGEEVRVKFTNNRRRMVSWQRSRDRAGLELRAHRMFAHASDDVEVVTALAGLLSGCSEGRDRVRQFIRDNREQIEEPLLKMPAARRIVLRPVGELYDLREVHRTVNDAHFDGKSTAHVTWGRALRRGRPKTVNFGSYDRDKNVITISRRLNAADIPRSMIEFVMYHEILHEALGFGETASGRRVWHGAEFRRRERDFPQYAEARAFERERWGTKHG